MDDIAHPLSKWLSCSSHQQSAVEISPLNLAVRGRKTGRGDKLVKANAPPSPGPDVEQGDVVPPVPAGAAQRDELLVSDYQADLERKREDR